MDVGQRIKELSADGGNAALDEIYQIIESFPEYTTQALDAFGVSGSPKAMELILDTIKNINNGVDDDIALHSIDVLGRIDTQDSLVDIFNYVSLFEVEPIDKLNRILKALDTYRENGSVFATTLSNKMMDDYPVAVALRVGVLKDRGMDQDEDAIDALGEIATGGHGVAGRALSALRDIGSDHAIDVLEDALGMIAENNTKKSGAVLGAIPDDDDTFDDMMRGLGIDPAPSDDDSSLDL